MTFRFRNIAKWAIPILSAVVAVAVYAAFSHWYAVGRAAPHSSETGEHGQNHAVAGTPGQADATSLKLSEQGQKNVGLKLLTIELRDFKRTISIPAMIAERPGRTRLTVAAPITGIVSRIYLIRGEAVEPGQPLFDLRLTHEDLVDKQSELLQAVEQLDVIKREVARLEKVAADGAVAGKRLLERQYEQQKIEAVIRAQQQALVLHSLTQEQIDMIVKQRQLLRQITVVAPQPAETRVEHSDKHVLQVSELSVAPGQHVRAGDILCTLSDHAELYIEGSAFEEDAQVLQEAATRRTPIEAVIEANGKGTHTVPDLEIVYVENEVELESRALRFYVWLPNELVRDEKGVGGHRFIGWRYKVGQRVKLFVPVEEWKNRVVLPIDAVVKEGADWFVFQKKGDHFERRPVYVEYRDQRWAVIASDGTFFPGDIVAAAGAYQMHLTMKNKAGGGVDPHAGHNH